MKLGLNDIKAITFGSLEITESEGWFCFERMSDEQKSVYDKGHENLRKRCECSASIMLDIITDSKKLAFNYRMEHFAASELDYGYFDVWENEVMIAHIGECSLDNIAGRAELTLAAGSSRVQIYFPNMFKMKVSDVELDDGASFSAPKKTDALILGDSITQGFSAVFPSLTYANIIIRELELNGVNQGIGGEIFRPEILGTVPLMYPKIITVALGINEWAGDVISLDNTRAYFEKLRRLYPDAKIFYISPIWCVDKAKHENNIPFDKMTSEFEAVAEELGAIAIRGTALMHRVKEFYSDGTHPNDQGFCQYGNALSIKLKEYI